MFVCVKPSLSSKISSISAAAMLAALASGAASVPVMASDEMPVDLSATTTQTQNQTVRLATASASQLSGPESIVLRFSASTSVEPSAAPALDVDAGKADISVAPATRAPAPQSGDLMTTSDVLAMMQAGQTAEATATSDLFSGVQLNVYFENETTGEVDSFAIAQCATLNFDSAQGGLYEQQAQCGADYYAYGVTPDGLEITKNGEQMLSLALDPGIYQLNAVPFLVEAR